MLFREKACPMLRIEMGSKGTKIYGACAKEATGVPLVQGWILLSKPGIFAKANLYLNEDREEISLIREKRKVLQN